MATRKIKNAKDLVTDELIYFKSHAQATFMSDGTTVEDKINGLQNGGGSSSGSCAYPQINHDNSDPIVTITPNTFHVWDEIGTLDVSLGAETTGIANEYLFQFTSGSEPTTLIFPDDIKWANDEAPVIEANKIYQISILKGLGSVMSWSNAPTLIDNKLEVVQSGKSYIIQSQYPVESSLNIILSNAPESIITFPAGSSSYSLGGSPITPSISMINPSEDNTYKYVW